MAVHKNKISTSGRVHKNKISTFPNRKAMLFIVESARNFTFLVVLSQSFRYLFDLGLFPRSDISWLVWLSPGSALVHFLYKYDLDLGSNKVWPRASSLNALGQNGCQDWPRRC